MTRRPTAPHSLLNYSGDDYRQQDHNEPTNSFASDARNAQSCLSLIGHHSRHLGQSFHKYGRND